MVYCKRLKKLTIKFSGLTKYLVVEKKKGNETDED